MRLLFYSRSEEHELAERFFNEFIERIMISSAVTSSRDSVTVRLER